jgi:hypothetical protein
MPIKNSDRQQVAGLTSHADFIGAIPSAVRKTRRRRPSDKMYNPTKTFYAHPEIVERAKKVQDDILGISQQHMATTEMIVNAFLQFVLDLLRHDKIALETYPDPNRRKMDVRWAGSGQRGAPKTIPTPLRRGRMPKGHRVSYRVSPTFYTQLQSIAGPEISISHLFFAMMEYAIKSYCDGHLCLSSKPKTVTSGVEPEYDRERQWK